jgi:hypothetical protein
MPILPPRMPLTNLTIKNATASATAIAPSPQPKTT